MSTSEADPGGGESSIKIAKNSFAGLGHLITGIKKVGGKDRLKAVGWHKDIPYYLGFIQTLAHERQHALEELTSSGGASDPDDDWLTTTKENSYNTDPNDKYSIFRNSALVIKNKIPQKDWFDDGEAYAQKVGADAYKKALKDGKNLEDWASPGGQY